MLKQLQFMIPAGLAEQTDPIIKSVAVSSDRVTATARVLHDPEGFAGMQLGEVLVAGITTPTWIPLFALASAVVTDLSKPVSHSSIVTHEYGLPAMLGTTIATKCIKNSQQIRMDGDAGTVTLLDEVDADAAGEAGNRKISSRARQFTLGALAAGAVIGVVEKRR